MMDNSKVYFHADDYGVTKEQSSTILSCHAQGVLNSISIIPNTPELGACLKLLNTEDAGEQIRRVLHLNFVEGRPVAQAEQVDMLIDDIGYFSCSFIQLLKWNYTHRGEKRKRLKEQLKCEIAAQLERVIDDYDYQITAIDSHQHYHMIPIIMEALLEVLDEKELTIQEIRIPVDPLIPLLRTPSMWLKVPVINWIKWAILWCHAGKARRLLRQRGICQPVFFGIFFTCEMKKDVVETLLPKYREYAQKREKNLELMFHPGNLTKQSELLDMRSKELEEFYMSDNRLAEAECLRGISKIVEMQGY